MLATAAAVSASEMGGGSRDSTVCEAELGDGESQMAGRRELEEGVGRKAVCEERGWIGWLADGGGVVGRLTG